MRTKMLCLLGLLGLWLGFGVGSSARAEPPDQTSQPVSEVPVTAVGKKLKDFIKGDLTSQPVSPVPIPGAVAAPVDSYVEPVKLVDSTMNRMIERYLDGLGAVGDYTMAPVQARYVADTFPGISFVGVYFEQWPLRVEPPEGLAQSDVFYMGADRQLLYLTGPEDLLDFFQVSWNPVVRGTTHAELLKGATKTWLRLSQEFSQDGFYQFSKPVVEVVGNTAYGMVAVEQGGTGYLWVTITIGPTGNLSVEEDRHIHPDNRPI